MDEARRYIPNHQSELEQILQEAHHRWLRPAEICEILRNYKRFNLRPDPPVQPPAGSLFLFDRKALRYFRNDGHRWRKKKDGKTVKEAHEKLKAGSVNVLHCYYAHGEDNDNFQRRSYWMLDGQLEHIVLVHYREVKEGYKSGISRLPVDPGSQVGSSQSSSVPCFAQVKSPDPTVQTSYASSPNKVGWSGQTLSSEFADVDSGDGPVPFSCALVQSIYGTMSHNASLPAHQVLGLPGSSSDHYDSWFAAAKFVPGTGSSIWTNIQTPSRDVDSLNEKKFHVDKKLYVEQPSGADFLTHKLTDATLDSECKFQDVVTCGDRLITDEDVRAVTSSSERLVQALQEHGFDIVRPYFQNYSGPQTVIASATQVEKKSGDCDANKDESGGLKKLDSFGRWMDKEIGRDCDDSLMASDSGNYWNALDAENDDKEVSSLSRQMQLDIDSLAPSLSQEQLFSICDFSPDWAYSGVEMKVLIVGTFLGSEKPSTGNKWGCMFGEFEVSAEVLTHTTIRCQVPFHAPGRVPFYVTCSNRLACSEVREFEYREKPAGNAYSMAVVSASEEEVRFQTRLAKLLYLGPERMWSDCSIESCDKCKLKNAIYSTSNGKNDWKRVEGTSMAEESDHKNSRDILIENMLKDRLPLWLAYKVHEGGKGPHVLDDKGQGVIHLSAALGYEWAMGPIVAAGVNPNFRDARGRTGLHWASYFGREEMVITLIRLGAAPGAVDDPTPAFPGGQKAADLASSRGNKGIAGYLAEADLINHLSSMSVNENVMSGVAANIAAQKAIETATEVVLSSRSLNEVSLKGSLAAVRKSAYAAALIQDAFRARSFHHRQLTMSADDSSEPSLDLVALGFLNKVRKGNYEDYLHSAAVKIQQKYRGWKGRKEFLKIRNRIVKIQAHVRGHQVRKHYKKVVWSVGIMEKLILRWRRKGAGLRGFQGEKASGNMVSETKKTDEYEFLRIGRKQKFAGFEKALARVKSMVRDPEAREQYMRMATKFENLKMGDEGSSSMSQQAQPSQKSRTEEDLDIFTVATKPG